MPGTAWRTWDDVVDTFLLERPLRGYDLQRHVLLLSIGRLDSWAALVSGEWILHAPLEVLMSDVPGFAASRTLALLERFFDWLHARGDLGSWQYDVLLSRIDDARAAHFRPRKRASAVKECIVRDYDRPRIAEEFASTLEAHQRPLGRALLDLLSIHFRHQLGSASPMPLGSLDVDALLVLSIDAGETDEARDATRIELTALSMFYRWLGETDRLEPVRADLLASELARGALGVGTIAQSLSASA